MQNRTILQNPILKTRKISTPKETKLASSPAISEEVRKTPTQLPRALVKPRPPSVRYKPTASPTTSQKTFPDKKVADKQANKETPTPPPSSRTDLKSSPLRVAASQTLSIKSSSRISTNSKNPADKRFSQPAQRPTPPPPPSVGALLSKEGLAKFAEVSSSVLQVATSLRPVTTRSLEALINREISNTLGDGVINREFSQGFVQATRELLEKLVTLYEGGKLNPKLLKDRASPNKSIIRANSATTVCYRDRYFKELVMNVLQSMTSSAIEEEVTLLAARSEESEERIRVIRDMVRTEAGLEPEDFRALEQNLEELRKSLSRNKQEVEQATLEVDRIISQQTVKQESMSSLQIPKQAREVLRACCDKRLKSGCDFGGREKRACENEDGCSKIKCSRNFAKTGSEKYKNSLNITGDKECFEKGNSDEIENIRPQLKMLVHEELLRLRRKEADILNRDREFDMNNGLEDTPKSSFESVEFKSATSNFSDKEEDEISEEETRIFLSALKAEIEERIKTNEDILSSGTQGVCIPVLPRIDEHEDEIKFRDTGNRTDSFTSVRSKISSSSADAPGTDCEFSECYDEHLNDVTPNASQSVEKHQREEIMIDRVKSKWFNREESEVNNVLSEMKHAFEMFKVMSDVFSSFDINEESKKETGDTNTSAKVNMKKELLLEDFTVGEVADVLVNISVKINRLPEYIRDIESNNYSTVEKEQAHNILSVLEKCISPSNAINHDVELVLQEASVSFPIHKFTRTFSFLSDTLKGSPKEMRSQSISTLNPPKSLIDTLDVLSSTVYFRDCFTSVKDGLCNQLEITKNVEILKSCNINEQSSSREFTLESLGDNSGGCRKKIYTHTRDIKNPDDLNRNLGKFENFMGLTASVMTIQNVSDMFLFLSTVLNDVPVRLKSEKVMDLDPPSTLLQALDVLYHEKDDNSVTYLDKKKSFASLTIQNVSDFLLTLSKTFYDIPDRLKGCPVVDMDPPASLLRAITLLTSISNDSIPPCNIEETEEEICEENHLHDQDNFFDAVASINSMS